jgi:hypothetical protein
MLIVSIPTSVGLLVSSNYSSLFSLLILYLSSFAYAVRRGCLLTGKEWGSPRFFVLAVALSCLTRALSFAACTIMSLLGGVSALGDRYRALLIQLLFNTGDWAAVNCYALLLLVWLEMLQRTRAHVYDPKRIRRDWSKVVIGFSVFVQLTQVGLYVAAFTTPPDVSQTVLNSIYITLACFNYALPALLLVGWTLSLFLYSGFPYRSVGARAAWGRFSNLVWFWTLGRVLWATGSLLLANGAIIASLSKTSWPFPLFMVALFVLAELTPFLACLGTDVLKAFALEMEPGDLREDVRAGGGGDGGGWGGAHALAWEEEEEALATEGGLDSPLLSIQQHSLGGGSGLMMSAIAEGGEEEEQ